MLKTILNLLLPILLGISATAQTVKRDSVMMGLEYSNDVFYQLTDKSKTIANNQNYHVAFSNLVSQDSRFYSTWLNPELTKAYVCTNYMAADYETMGSNANWRELFNQDTSWGKGAFSQGKEAHPRYTWAKYFSNGDLRGDSVYKIQLKDTATGNYSTEYKIWLRQRLSDNGKRTWTIRYGKLDNSWDTTIVLEDLENSQGNFMYYDFLNHQELTREPDTKTWDLVFTRYTTFTQGLNYPVTGVLSNYNVECAKLEMDINDSKLTEMAKSAEFTHYINGIGFEWKTFNRMTSVFELEQNTTRVIKVNQANGSYDLYAIQFVKFEGRSTGKTVFDYAALGNFSSTREVNTPKGFVLYPNPAQNELNWIHSKRVSSVQIRNINGQLVSRLNHPAENNIQINSLKAGVYLVQFTNEAGLTWVQKFTKN